MSFKATYFQFRAQGSLQEICPFLTVERLASELLYRSGRQPLSLVIASKKLVAEAPEMPSVTARGRLRVDSPPKYERFKGCGWVGGGGGGEALAEVDFLDQGGWQGSRQSGES